MSESEFLQLRLRGGRFTDKGVECSFAQDLLAIGKLITRVAKDQHLERYANKKVLPNSKLDDFEVKLVGMEEGSTILQLECCQKNGRQHLLGISETIPLEIEIARDLMYDTISSNKIKEGTEISKEVVKMINFLKNISKNLDNNEFIEFNIATIESPAILSRYSHDKLPNIKESIIQENEYINLRGSIYEVNQESMTFELRSVKNQQVIGSFAEQNYETVLKAFSEYRRGSRVLIEGVGKKSRRGLKAKFESIDQITLLADLDVPLQLSNLHNLENGWYDGDGKAPDHDALEWFGEKFDIHYPRDVSLPYIYPTLEGGVQLEWSHQNNEIIFEVDLITRTGKWLWFNKKSDDQIQKKLYLNNEEDWIWMVTEVKNKIEGKYE